MYELHIQEIIMVLIHYYYIFILSKDLKFISDIYNQVELSK